MAANRVASSTELTNARLHVWRVLALIAAVVAVVAALVLIVTSAA